MPEAEARPAPDGLPAEERRTVTVLFADISGYTAVGERLGDHETLKSVADRFLGRLTQEVVRYAGHIDKYIGDAVMAVFGAPTAHEDDPERAVRAALGMQTAMAELNDWLCAEHGFDIALCIGVNTGPALAGLVAGAYTVTGDAVNVASRLQHEASPGAILVGERTQRATAGLVEYERLEPLALKGKQALVPAWRAVGLAPRSLEPEGRARRQTPLVGRREELAALDVALARVTRNHSPYLMTVLGPAGVGKTRLLRELERSLGERGPPIPLRRGRCVAFGSGIVYWPLSEMLRAECGITDEDRAAAAWSKLTGRLEPLLSGEQRDAEQVARLIALIARLLGMDVPGEIAGPDSEDSADARGSFFGAVRAVLEGLAGEGPVVIVWEDVHWADEGMLDLIDYLSQWLRAPVLQVCLARDDLLERRPDWRASGRTAASLFLEPLAGQDTRELITSLFADSGSGHELLDELVERSGGNPLFAEEIVRRLSERGSADPTALPETVQALLAVRLDALTPVQRAVVAQAAVAGFTFWEGVLAPVALAAGCDLGSTLATLREKDIIVPCEGSEFAGEQGLAFKHALIREVAYGMLPKAARAHKHAEVGALIEQRAGTRSDEVVALLADHYGRAVRLSEEAHLGEETVGSLRAKALQFAETAGDVAAAVFSNLEAFEHYAAAAELAPEDLARWARIVEKQGDVALRLGRVDRAIDAWQRCLERSTAAELPEHSGELHRKIGLALEQKGEHALAMQSHQLGVDLLKGRPPSLVLVRLYEDAAWLYMQVGDNMSAIYAAEKALRLAERSSELRAASRAHGVVGHVFDRVGDTVTARTNLERSTALARELGAGETILALLDLGRHLEHAEADYAAAARAYSEALALAEQIGDVPGQIESHAAQAQLAFYRCDWKQVQESSDASAELADREGMVSKLCLPYRMRGLLAWRAGEMETSAQLFRRAHQLAEQAGWPEVAIDALLGLAVTLHDQGDIDGADQTVAQALGVCDRAGLVAHSIQANATRARLLALAGRHQAARAAAAAASATAQQVSYPAARASAAEARGITGEREAGAELLGEARALWARLGRRLDAARCQTLIAQRLGETDTELAGERFAAAAAAYAELDVPRLAQQPVAGIRPWTESGTDASRPDPVSPQAGGPRSG